MQNKSDSRKRQTMIPAAAVAALTLAGLVGTAHAQTTGTATLLQKSLFAPTGAPIAQPDFGAPTTGTTYGFNDPTYIGYQDFVDNGSNAPPGGPGQSFSVTAPLTLNTLTVKGGGGGSAAAAFAGNVWTITLGTINNLNNFTPVTILDTETVDVTGIADPGANAYVSFGLANPLTLTPGVNYVYMIHRTAGGAYYGFAKSENTVDHYTGGADLYGDNTGAGGTPPNALVANGIHNGPGAGGYQDRTFFINGNLAAPAVTFGVATANWVKNGSGTWTTGVNWSSNPVVPGAAGSNVTFNTNGGAITATNITVSLAQAASVNTMVFDLPGGGYTISNGASGSINIGAGYIDTLTGDHTIAVPVTGASAAEVTAQPGSSMTINSFTSTGYGNLRAYGGGTVRIGGLGNCSLNITANADRGMPGVTYYTVDNSSPGFLYAINTDETSSFNTGLNSVMTSGVYGPGRVIIPAGGNFFDAVYGDNMTNTAIAGAGNVVIGNTGNAAVGHFAQFTGDNSGFSGQFIVGTNVVATGTAPNQTFAYNQYTLRVGADTALGNGTATNRLVLDGGILQASAPFNAVQAVTVNSLASQPAGSTITDSKIDTNGFDVGVGPITSAGPLTKIGVGKLTVGNIRGGTLAINAGSVAVATSATRTAGVSILNGLTLAGSTGAWTSVLDLSNNDLIVHNGDAVVLRDQLKQGYNGGLENGTGGILSSTAASSTSPKTVLGYGTLVGTVDGQTTTATDVVIRYTVVGDATLDLTVGFDDLLALAQNYGGSNKVWSQGDGNYDGLVNFDDLLALAQNYNRGLLADGAALGGVGGSIFASDLALAQSLVPEPMSMLALVAIGTLATRRRRM